VEFAAVVAVERSTTRLGRARVTTTPKNHEFADP
jgi:hypothetical protein